MLNNQTFFHLLENQGKKINLDFISPYLNSKIFYGPMANFLKFLDEMSLDLYFLNGKESINRLVTFLNENPGYSIPEDLHFKGKYVCIDNNFYGLVLKKRDTNIVVSTYGFILYRSFNLFEDLFVNGSLIRKDCSIKYYISDEEELHKLEKMWGGGGEGRIQDSLYLSFVG